MRRRGAGIAGLLSLASAGLGCGKPSCDQTKLEAVAEALDDRSATGRDEALDGLSEACPTMPRALSQSLVASFGTMSPDIRSQIYVLRFDDPRYVAARSAACPASAGQWQAAVSSRDRETAVFEACALARTPLLDPSSLPEDASEATAFTLEDLEAYVLYQWLTSTRNDPALSAEVAGGLLSARATEAELATMCRDRDSGCRRAFAHQGVALPSSTNEQRPGEGVELRVSHTGVWLGDDQLMRLDAGTSPADGVVDHVAPSVHAALVELETQARVRASNDMQPWDGRLVVAADRSTPYATVADLLFTSARAGFREHQLLVDHDGRRRALSLGLPPDWLAPIRGPSRRGNDGRPRLELAVHDLGVDFQIGTQSSHYPGLGSCTADPGNCLHRSALTSAFAAAHAAHPGSSAVTLYVDPEIPLQTLVTLIDLARGDDCDLARGHGDELPASCMFWAPVIDGTQPVYWNIGRTLTLGAAEAKRSDRRKRGGPSVATMLSTYADQRQQIAACLRADLVDGSRTMPGVIASIVDGLDVTVLWSQSGNDGESIELAVWLGQGDDPFAPYEVEECIGRVFDTPAADPNLRTPFVQAERAELRFRAELAP